MSSFQTVRYNKVTRVTKASLEDLAVASGNQRSISWTENLEGADVAKRQH